MRVIFNNKVYEKNNRSGRGLEHLCFEIFKQFIGETPNSNYKSLQSTFNKYHCSNNFIVLSEKDWKEKILDTQKRYFDAIAYNDLYLYFSKSWGNNGGECDNVNSLITSASEQGYDMQYQDNEEETFVVEI
jgi:hypothetical protein